MNDYSILWLCILVSLIGIAAIGAMIYFGRLLFKPYHEFWEHLIHQVIHGLDQTPPRTTFARYLADCYTDFLQRRNEFWTTYGQGLNLGPGQEIPQNVFYRIPEQNGLGQSRYFTADLLPLVLKCLG